MGITVPLFTVFSNHLLPKFNIHQISHDHYVVLLIQCQMCFVMVNFQESYPVQAVMCLKECQKSWREEGEEEGEREGREDTSNCAIAGAVNVTIPLTLTT